MDLRQTLEVIELLKRQKELLEGFEERTVELLEEQLKTLKIIENHLAKNK